MCTCMYLKQVIFFSLIFSFTCTCIWLLFFLNLILSFKNVYVCWWNFKIITIILFKGLQHSSAEFSQCELQLITKTNFWQACLTQLFHSLWPWTDDMNIDDLSSLQALQVCFIKYFIPMCFNCVTVNKMIYVIKTKRGRGLPQHFLQGSDIHIGIKRNWSI